jgi:hypothetical protein
MKAKIRIVPLSVFFEEKAPEGAVIYPEKGGCENRIERE